jgi:D-alanyl-lipoteichoic acid acyltransferase DltB (MBOAT superfamily)
MLFTSAEFLLFFFILYIFYFAFPHRWQNALLLVASFVFYGFWNWRFLGLLFFSIGVDFLVGIKIEEARVRGNAVAAKRWLQVSIALNLSVLGFFKYFTFFYDSFLACLTHLGIATQPLTLKLILPVGLSFYTFQSLGYCIDIYRGKLPAHRRLDEFALFIAFFPQLLAGPIERARRILPQLTRPRVFHSEDLAVGSWLVFWGLFKKVFIADNLAPYTQWGVEAAGARTAADVYVAIFAYSIRFYCDFSGYSDMARGLARLLGIHLSLNFNLPYFASNPIALWSRWHITLSNWFRDYVFIPLAQALPYTSGRYLAAVATMALVGLWHGADWKYILWGTAWGIVLATYRFMQDFLVTVQKKHPQLRKLLTVGGVLLTFHLWMVIGVFFTASTIPAAFSLLHTLFTELSASKLTARDAATVLYFTGPLLFIQVFQVFTGRLDTILLWPWPARCLLYIMLTVFLVVSGVHDGQKFFYFAF